MLSNAATANMVQTRRVKTTIQQNYTPNEDLGSGEGDGESLGIRMSPNPKLPLDKFAAVLAETGQVTDLHNIRKFLSGSPNLNATALGDPAILKKLIDAGLDAKTLGSPAPRNPEILELLLDNGLNANHHSGFTGSLLAGAAWDGQVDCVRLLLERGADPNTRGGRDCTTTALAAAAGAVHPNLETVELLLDYGAKIRGSGALKGAVKMGQIDVVSLLLERGADVNDTAWIVNGEPNGQTPLRLARKRGYEDIVDILIAAGGTEELIPDDGFMLAPPLPVRTKALDRHL